ncbi:MAG: methyltransferase domain-containing protein [Rhodospirillaceae bacterium]|nr:methyltransferase domain-containing protein [Rhodospirillaceae bacterium]MBT6137405.1 methyltransferase domain-containing protein [Rhodospirillaceae bacterium]
MVETSKRVQEHYSSVDLADRIIGLTGVSRDALTVAALEPFDHMHLRGSKASREMVEALAPGADWHVVDVGAGICGPARMAVAATGCQVTALDLSDDFCACATELNRLVGLQDRIAVRQGDALAMPFADATFDGAITHHAAMNISDKAALYREIARVLKPGGRFVLYDVMRGPGEEPYYPVPWATTSEISFLATPEDVRGHLAAAGFAERDWQSLRQETLDWMAAVKAAREAAAAAGDGTAPANTGSVLMGASGPEKIRNVARNLGQDRITVVMGIFEKDA